MIYTLQSPMRRQQKQMKENNRNLLKMFAWIGFSSSILWIGLILVSIYLYGPSDLQNIPDLVLGFSNRRDLVMNILFYSFWLGVIYWPARLAIARNQPLLPWRSNVQTIPRTVNSLVGLMRKALLSVGSGFSSVIFSQITMNNTPPILDPDPLACT